MIQHFTVDLTLTVDPELPGGAQVKVQYSTPDAIMAIQVLAEGLKIVAQEEAKRQAQRNALDRARQANETVLLPPLPGL